MVGCRKCPVFAICPVKSLIGDYRKPADPQAAPETGKKQDDPKPRP